MTQNKKSVLIIDNNPSSADEIKRHLQKDSNRFVLYTSEPSLLTLEAIYSEPPDLIIINQPLKGDGWKELCRRIKADIVFGHLPIMLILQSSKDGHEIDWEKMPVDDYLQKPFDPHEIKSRISLIFARSARVHDSNPLTHLPGNHSIMREIQSWIDSEAPFAVGYVDLDYFKSYNDRYGFLRGDEIIKMTARLLTNSVRKLDSVQAFVGHVGGDDFIFIVPPDALDGLCREIIRNFDLIVGDFYDEEDKIRGYIEATNRQGTKDHFPIMSISIAVATNEYRPIKHIGRLSAIAAEMKKRVKSMQGSNYAKDLRGSKRSSRP
ncbi:MAG: diguanylate cyclase [Thermodesulfobacteriota bacterium]